MRTARPHGRLKPNHCYLSLSEGYMEHRETGSHEPGTCSQVKELAVKCTGLSKREKYRRAQEIPP